MNQLDRIEAKLNWLRWQVKWGSLYAPDGKYVVVDPHTLEPIDNVVHLVPKEPVWPEEES